MSNGNVFDLSKTVDSEIESKQLYVQEKIPANFAFTIHDKDDPRDKRVIDLLSKVFGSFTRDDLGLTREFDGERIQVKAQMVRDWNRGKKDPEKKLELTVKIFKKNGKKMTFNVCNSKGLTVESVSIVVPSDGDDYDRSQDFKVVEDSSMHLALKEYLRVRGIDRSTADFLHKYLLRKSKNQPLIVLKNLKKFLEV